MKIVVLDGYTENPGDLSWDEFRQFGEIEVFDRTPYETDIIIKRIGDAEIVLTNKCPINREVLFSCSKLRYIGVLATGFNIVDVESAKEKEITVTNIPTYGTDSVAQFAIALLLEICSGVGHHSEAVKSGRWESCEDWCFWDQPLMELSGKTLGIIGFGRIGQATGRIASAMGMKVLAYNRSTSDTGKRIAEYVSLDELLRRSDVIALHCPATKDTINIINNESITKMKDGVILINNSRGQLVDEQALAEALKSGKIRAAAVDVVSSEPIRPDNPLLRAKNCIITPHISWAPLEARERIMNYSIENLKAFLAGNAINTVC